MNDSFYKNLKTTFKAVGVIWAGLSAMILLNCYREEDFSNALDVIYFLSFAPVVAVQTYGYTKLKSSSIHRFVCALMFAFLGIFSSTVFYFILQGIEGTGFNIRLALFFCGITFVCLAGLYYQLPWKREDW